MSKVVIGAHVMFSQAVVRQSGHSARTANMRGVVLAIAGKTATVDCGVTFTSEDGRSVRGIPLVNLALARLPVGG
jgi:hypothetical protein